MSQDINSICKNQCYFSIPAITLIKWNFLNTIYNSIKTWSMQYLHINLTKYVGGMSTENKHFWKKLKVQIDVKIYQVHGLKDSILLSKISILPKLVYNFHAIPRAKKTNGTDNPEINSLQMKIKVICTIWKQF